MDRDLEAGIFHHSIIDDLVYSFNDLIADRSSPLLQTIYAPLVNSKVPDVSEHYLGHFLEG